MEDEILDAGALNSALNEVLESIESALESHSALNTSLSNAGDLNITASFSAEYKYYQLLQSQQDVDYRNKRVTVAH